MSSRSHPRGFRRGARFALLAGLTCAAAAACGAGASGTDDADRVALEQFLQRTRDYVQLRDKAAGEDGRPPLAETTSPEQITERERALATAIRDARAGAQVGDVFGSARKPLAAIARRDWRERMPVERNALRRELPPLAPPAVNEPYPSTLELATVPPKLLEALPVLPEGLEYRLVGPHLILRDVDANLVVDVAPDLLSELR